MTPTWMRDRVAAAPTWVHRLVIGLFVAVTIISPTILQGNHHYVRVLIDTLIPIAAALLVIEIWKLWSRRGVRSLRDRPRSSDDGGARR